MQIVNQNVEDITKTKITTTTMTTSSPLTSMNSSNGNFRKKSPFSKPQRLDDNNKIKQQQLILNDDNNNIELINEILDTKQQQRNNFVEVEEEIVDEVEVEEEEEGEDVEKEIKYMKGYVNVLKERFTRKANEFTTNNGNNNNTVAVTAVLNAVASTPLISNSPKTPKTKPTTKSDNNNNNKRRSTSPFAFFQPQQHENGNSFIDNFKLRKNFKLFASSDNLKNTTCNDIIKCTYLNEINKDELPKPNFVSSVKNLFEKKTNSTNHSQQQQRVSLPPSSPQFQTSPQTIVQMQTNNDEVETIVDRIKQNGNLVYDHTTTNGVSFKQKTIIKQKEPIQQAEIVAEKCLSFNERKELFDRKQTRVSLPATIQSQEHLSNEIINKKYSNKTSLPTQPLKQLNLNDNDLNTNKRQKFEGNNNSESPQVTSINSISEPINMLANNKDEFNDSNNDDMATTTTTTTSNGNEENINQILSQQKQKLKSKSTVKTKTFYGGQVINDIKTLNGLKPNTTNNAKNANTIPALKTQTSIESTIIEFIGAGVKLTKSSLSMTKNQHQKNSKTITSSKKRSVRVNFIDEHDYFEYPSFEFVLKEMGIDPDTDPDLNHHNGNNKEDDDYSNDDILENDIYSNNTNNKLGNFNNFKPSWYQKTYELGTLVNNDENSNGDGVKYRNSTKSSSDSQNGNSADNTDNNNYDFLPTKDAENKRWSCEMDSNINILF